MGSLLYGTDLNKNIAVENPLGSSSGGNQCTAFNQKKRHEKDSLSGNIVCRSPGNFLHGRILSKEWRAGEAAVVGVWAHLLCVGVSAICVRGAVCPEK